MLSHRRWIKSLQFAGLVGSLSFSMPVVGQELPKLPVVPPPSIPMIPSVPSTPPTPPVMPPSLPSLPSTPSTPGVPSVPTTPPVAPSTPTKPMSPTAPTPPASSTPSKPSTPAVNPAGYIPPADSDPRLAVPPQPVMGKVTVSPASQDGATALPAALLTARETYSKLRDYSGFLIRQESLGGKLLAEQTCELRCRVNPFSISVKVVSPKPAAGQDTIYNPTKSSKVQHLAAGVDGIRYGYQLLSMDDPKVLMFTKHPINQVGLLAMIDRVDRFLATEKRMNNPVQVLMSEYTFLGKPCTKYELFADKPHPARYAQRVVIYIDKESKLPVRFEAFDMGKLSKEPELMEMASFVNLKFNTGLSSATFER